MYLAHFGLREFPFSITPDTSYFFASGGSQEALNTLLVAARTGEGFIKITGEVGTGKTLICRKLINSLGPDFVVAYIPTPCQEPLALFMELGTELGLEFAADARPSQHQLQKTLMNRLMELTRDGKRAILCLDEAQAMPIETLEALRLLTNLETEKRKLLQVVVFGQPELDDKLSHPAIRQLRQRITFDYHLGPLARTEPDAYLCHRLRVAGYRGPRLFSAWALWLIQGQTRRTPRLLNIVAHKTLLSAYGKGKTTVGVSEVIAALHDTASLRHQGAARWQPALWLLFLGGCAAAFARVYQP